jgi:hypothetical protein
MDEKMGQNSPKQTYQSFGMKIKVQIPVLRVLIRFTEKYKNLLITNRIFGLNIKKE